MKNYPIWKSFTVISIVLLGLIFSIPSIIYDDKSDIDSMKSWGFNLVRAPIHYNLFTLPIEEEPFPGSYTELDVGFKLLDSLLSWCKENEIYIPNVFFLSDGKLGLRKKNGVVHMITKEEHERFYNEIK